MTLVPRPENRDKYCFTYCGDDRCDCGACDAGLGYRPSEDCLRRLYELEQAQIRGAIAMLKNPPLVD
jgi:hypothetical protein